MNTNLKVIKDQLNNHVKIELGNFPIRVKQKETCFTAFNPHFKTLGFGKSEEEAVDDLKSSLDIFFKVHIERGSLEKALNELGWKKDNDTFKKPKYFNTPSLLGNQKNLEYAYA